MSYKKRQETSLRILQLPRFLLYLSLILVACRASEPTSGTVSTVTTTRALKQITTILPSVGPTNSPNLTSTPSVTIPPIPTSTLVATVPAIPPTQTPLPVVSLYVPARWRERANTSLFDQQRPKTRKWLVVSDEAADVRLLNQAGGLIVTQEPLAFAVPFTTEWENISAEESQNIVSQGHSLITVVPWSDMPRGFKALRIDGRSPDDDDYPWQDIWSLQAEPGYEEAANELLPWLRAASANPLVRLVAVGDIMLDRSLGDALQLGNLAYPFAAVSEKLQEADITLGNVESALSDMGEPQAKRYPFQAPPEAAESLAMAGFDVVSLANNHAMDFGPASLLQAITLLQEQGVAAIGAGANRQEAHEPAIFEINGLKLAFLAYVHVPVEASTGFDTASWTATSDDPGLAWANPEEIKDDVTAIHDRVDLVIVVLHSGFEYVAAPSEPQNAAARAAVDAGADLVIGHHAHILQGIEYYGDGVIVYGTGNFAFEIDGPPETALFDLWLDKDGVRQIEIQPAIIRFGGQPRLAESWEAPAIRNRVYYLTKLLNAR